MIVPDGDSLEVFEEITESLYHTIRKLPYYQSIRLIRNYKLPLIKLVLKPEYDKLEIELFLSNKNNIASRYVSFTNKIFTYYP